MKGFLKTFGKGILYFILSPFALIFLILFGIYLFFLNIFTFFATLKKKKSKKEYVNKLDQKALNILKGNKYEEEILNIPSQNNITNNNIVITNKEDLMSLIKSLKEEESNKSLPLGNSKLITDESSNYVIEEKPLVVRGEKVKREK